jgi:hypothetical protein
MMLLALLFVSCSGLHLNFTQDFSKYSLTHDGLTLFESNGVAVFAEGEWRTQVNGTLKLVDHSAPSTWTDPVFGQVDGLKLTWSWAECDKCMHTSYMNYGSSGSSSGSGVVFTLTFDKGVKGTSMMDYLGTSRDEVITNWPAFTTSAADKLTDTLSWAGSFVGANIGTFEKNSQGPQGGPTVFFNHTDPLLETVVVGSALNNFKSTSAGPGTIWDGSTGWAPGIPATIKQLPAGWEQKFVLHAGSTGGITATIGEWASLLQQVHAPTAYKLPDVTLTNIGYQTGAACTPPIILALPSPLFSPLLSPQTMAPTMCSAPPTMPRRSGSITATSCWWRRWRT